jgi:hypothetical protein
LLPEGGYGGLKRGAGENRRVEFLTEALTLSVRNIAAWDASLGEEVVEFLKLFGNSFLSLDEVLVSA